MALCDIRGKKLKPSVFKKENFDFTPLFSKIAFFCQMINGTVQGTQNYTNLFTILNFREKLLSNNVSEAVIATYAKQVYWAKKNPVASTRFINGSF